MAMLVASMGTCVFGFCEGESEQLVDSDAIAVYRVGKETTGEGGVAYRASHLTFTEGATVDGTPSYFRSDDFALVLKEAAAVVLPLERLVPLSAHLLHTPSHSSTLLHTPSHSSTLLPNLLLPPFTSLQ